MPNQLNKNKNKLKDKDEIHTAQGNLILAQQAERLRRFQKIANGNKSAEKLLEETRQRVELVEEAREEFLNLYSPRGENPDGRESTHTARSTEGARAWSELFVRDTLPHGTTSEDPSSPRFAVVETADVGEKPASVGVQIVGAGVQTAGVGVQTVGAGVQTTGVGVQSHGVGVNNASVARPSNARLQNLVVMARPKEKLPKFDGDGMTDPIRHCKICETIWRANGITNANEWVRQFPATLRGVAIDWFTDTDPQKLNSWDNIKKEFIAKFQLLCDDNEIIAEIFNTKQGRIKLFTSTPGN